MAVRKKIIYLFFSTSTWISYVAYWANFSNYVSFSTAFTNPSCRVAALSTHERKHSSIILRSNSNKQNERKDETKNEQSSSLVENSKWGSSGSAKFTGVQLNNHTNSDGKVSTISSTLDYMLSVILSDVGSIILGSLGLIVCVVNHVVWQTSFDDASSTTTNIQSRTDILAAFSSIAILLNGVTKLDVTSALAETVVLEGYQEADMQYVLDVGERWLFTFLQDTNNIHTTTKDKMKERFQWALQSLVSCTPAKSAVLMIYNETASSWVPGIFTGIVPERMIIQQQQKPLKTPRSISTPILDRFLLLTKTTGHLQQPKESYLPTLQALPGKVEFLTYLPQNTQAVLILPIFTTAAASNPNKENISLAVLVLESATAKSFTPRDIAWCQVIASRMSTFRRQSF